MKITKVTSLGSGLTLEFLAYLMQIAQNFCCEEHKEKSFETTYKCLIWVNRKKLEPKQN